jgi:Sugar (and other) transporter
METINCCPVYPRTYLLHWSAILPGNVCASQPISLKSILQQCTFTENGHRPRWLVEKGQLDRARASLQYLRAVDPSDPAVTAELVQIQSSVEAHGSATKSSWTVLFTHRSLFERLWRAALLQFMAQMCGNTAMKYYLPSIFISLGLGRRMSLMVGGIESTLKIGCTIIDMLIIDRVGRRLTLIVGCLVMSLALLVCPYATIEKDPFLLTRALQINGVLPIEYPNNINHAADYTCVVFIFFFTFGYSLGFGPASWVYGSEVCSCFTI